MVVPEPVNNPEPVVKYNTEPTINYDPATVESNANPGQATSYTNSGSWQEEARRAGWQAPEDNSGFQQSSPQTQPMQTTPVDIGAGSSPMVEPLTPENKSGMSSWSVNKDNGLPDEMTLAEAFEQIKLHPTEIGALLSNWASQHHGSANQNLSTRLNEEATKLTNPETYKNNGSDRDR